MARLKSFVANSMLVVGSLATCLLIGELFVFRFVLLPSDVPATDFANGIVRYVGNQSGVWRVRNEIAAPYAINAQGWNSGVGDYSEHRSPGVARIAVVGDSFVEALTVAHTDSLGERLVQEFPGAEVFRFGMSGAPLSQYLHMVEREVVRYRPDWIVVVLIHNDFDESFLFVPGRYTSSFLKLRVEDGRVVGEVAPSPWKPSAVEWLRKTASARYFYYRWQVKPEIVPLRLFGPALAASGPYGANIAAISRRAAEVEVVTDYVFGRLKAATAASGARLLFAMDADRSGIYSGEADTALARLNRMAAAVAQANGIPFLDLHGAFAADWKANHARFEFRSDAHWNERGHAVAARAIAEKMRALK